MNMVSKVEIDCVKLLAEIRCDNRDMKQQIKELQTRVDSLTSEKYEAEKQAAVAKAKFDQLTESTTKK